MIPIKIIKFLIGIIKKTGFYIIPIVLGIYIASYLYQFSVEGIPEVVQVIADVIIIYSLFYYFVYAKSENSAFGFFNYIANFVFFEVIVLCICGVIFGVFYIDWGEIVRLLT